MQRVDVVIPTYNRLWALKRIIPSYLKMPEVCKIIIVNDCSDDGTLAWIEEHYINEPRIFLITHKCNQGASVARNTGADYTSAPFVIFVDDDMFFEQENAISIMLENMQLYSGDIISPIITIGENTTLGTRTKTEKLNVGTFSIYSPTLLERRPIRKIWNSLPMTPFITYLATGIMLMKREVLNSIRYNNLGRSSYRDETDFQLSAAAAGFVLLASPDIILVDMARNQNQGGCHSSSYLRYEWEACKNNWHVLQTHEKTLRDILGIRMPIIFMQGLFLLEHLANRMPRTLVFIFSQYLKNINKKSGSTSS